jgi:type I restriction enzyme, S subunit
MSLATITATSTYVVLWKDLERWAIPSSRLLRRFLPAEWTRVRIGDLVKQVTERVKVAPDSEYRMAGVKWYGEGIFHRETVRGGEMSASQVTPLVPGALIYNRLFAWKESFAVVPPEFDGYYVSSEFPQFIPDTERISAEYLYLFCTREATTRAVNAASTGSSAVSRNRFKEEQFLGFEIPLPPLAEQRAIVSRWHDAKDDIGAIQNGIKNRIALTDSRFFTELGLSPPDAMVVPRAFAAWWKDVDRWGFQMVALNGQRKSQSPFPEIRLEELCRIGSGGTPSRKRPDYFGGDIPWVKTTEVRNEVITSTEETISELGLRNSSARIYPKGSLIIAMYGQGATRGRTAKLGIDAATNQACAVLFNIHEHIETDFLWFFLMSQYESMRALASGNNQPNLNAEMIANLLIPLPPRAIQQKLIREMVSGREEIARERETAERQAQDFHTEIEALIAGAKRVSKL